MIISIFNRANQTKSIGTLLINDFLSKVKNGHWKQETEKVRSIEDHGTRQRLKLKTMQGVTVSGVFDERNQDKLISHSGFISIDFDDVSDQLIDPLKKDKFTYALVRSVSGNGFFSIIKINQEKHSESFDWLRSYYFKEYGLVIDDAPRNVASIRYVSYDPDLYLNEESAVSKYRLPKPKKIIQPKIQLTASDFEAALSEVLGRGIDLAQDDYGRYLRIGFALASEFKENGRQYFHDIVSQGSKYIFKNADKQYNYCLKGSRDGIGIGTLYHYFKEVGIELKNSLPSQVIPFTKSRLNTGETKDSLKKTLKEVHGLNDEQVDLALKVAPDSRLLEDDYGSFLNGFESYLINRWSPRFNVIKMCFEVNGKEVTGKVYNSIAKNTKKEVGNPKVTDVLIKQYLFNSEVPEYNPIKEWIEQHRDIERGGELKKLLDAYELPSDSPLNNGAMSKENTTDIFITRWLVGLVATINGKVVRSVLTMIGPQNCGKSRWFRDLLPSDFKDYYAESRFDQDKDDYILMCKKLIILDDDASSKRKSDEAKFKELASKDFFTVRVPYAESAEDYKRLALLCMTSNPETVINDPTGNTRILPVPIGRFDFDKLNAVDRDALFMELVDHYENGVPYELEPDEFNVLNSINNLFEHTVVEIDLVEKYCVSDPNGKMTVTDVYLALSEISKVRLSDRRIGAALRKIFGEAKSIRFEKGSRKAFHISMTGAYEAARYRI